jgi:hypothetical protein
MPLGISKLNGLSRFLAPSGSRTAKTITATNVTVSTTQSRFGGASAFFDPALTTYNLEITPATDFTFGTANFTVEMWVYVNNVAVLRNFWSSNSTSQSLFFYIQTNRSLNFYTDATGQINGLSGGIALNTWTHVALSRSSGTTRGFINGTQAFSTATVWNSTGPLNAWIGRNDMSGYIDEVRVSNIARYTSNFTAPSAAFTNDANTILLVHCNGTNGSTSFPDDNA